MSIEDKAQEHEAFEWELRNSARKGPMKYTQGEPGYGPALCIVCEDDMPEVRRSYGFTLCVECKTVQERRSLLPG